MTIREQLGCLATREVKAGKTSIIIGCTLGGGHNPYGVGSRNDRLTWYRHANVEEGIYWGQIPEPEDATAPPPYPMLVVQVGDKLVFLFDTNDMNTLVRARDGYRKRFPGVEVDVVPAGKGVIHVPQSSVQESGQ